MASHQQFGLLWWMTVFHMLAVSVANLIPSQTVYPSSRILYYLHTTPATWSSARDTCARYGAHLVHNHYTGKLFEDLFVLGKYLGWNHAFSSLDTRRVWSGLYHNRVDDKLYWDACKDYNVRSVSNDVRKAGLELSRTPDTCASINVDDVSTDSESCNNLRPYICQIDEGECWFLAVDKTAFIDDNPHFYNGSLDLKTCAQKCREEEPADPDGAECWGFTFRDPHGECQLYLRDKRHAPLQNISYSLREADVTSYMKICTGGLVTAMNAVSRGSQDVTCHGVGTSTDGWINDVCFCQCDLAPSVLQPSMLILTENEKIDEIIERLRVDPSNTSSAYRKLNSAEDSRTSSTNIGTVGVVMLSLTLGAILVFDLRMLHSHLTACLTRRPENLMTSPQANKYK